MNPNDVQFKFCELLGDDEHRELCEYPHGEITLDIGKEDGQWKIVRGMLKANNPSPRPPSS